MSQSHYFSPDPNQAEQRMDIEYALGGRDFRLTTDRGVFSRTKVDYGTDVLLRAILAEQAVQPSALTVSALDLGCGYGVVSVVLNALFRHQRWTGVDVNARAVRLAQENARRYRLEINYHTADGINPAWGPFDLIAANPPIRTGKKVIYRLFEEARDALAHDGSFYLVIRKKQGSESASCYLEELFADVTTIEKKGGYHIIRCRRQLQAEQKLR